MKSLALVFGISWALVAFDNGRIETEQTAPLFPKARKASLKDLPQQQVESLDEMLSRYADKYAVPEQVWRLVYEYESTSGKNIKPRFEAHVPAWLLHKDRPSEFRHEVKKFATTKEKLRLLATSHGPLQVMGYHAISYGIDPELLANDLETQIELGMVRLANPWHATRGKPKVERAKITGKAYNGGDKYAARMASDIKRGVKYS